MDSLDVVGPPEQISQDLLPGRLEILGDVDVSEGIVEAEVVDGEPLEVGDPLPVGQGHGDLLVEVALQDVGPAVLGRNDEALLVRPLGGARPEEGVLSVPVVHEVLDEEGELVDGVHLAVHLVVVGVERGCRRKRKVRSFVNFIYVLIEVFLKSHIVSGND